ncbi:MAG: sigma-54-dependent Fis family transcriptional regulator [Pseudomonadota bacterium]|nr:sigma-54-dependent Fis family transcriptional regulator [Pseudomonadota bacterium]
MSDRLTQAVGSSLRSLKERAAEPGAIARDRLPGEIQRSWTRCARQGVSLAGSRDPDRLSARELKERAERFERLVGGAAPIMHNLSRQIANTRSMVILSDPEGLILHSVGDDDFVSRAERVALQPGVSWDEASKGTNAIGTAAVERTAVLVHAGEHYMERNQFLTCSASPIFDGFGDLAGVLDISGDYRSYQDHTLALVRLGAQMIEDRLFDEAARGCHLVRFHPQRAYLFSMAEGRAAFSEAGMLVAVNQPGRELLAAAAVGEDFERLFGFPWEQALARAHGAAGSVLACTLPRGAPVALTLTLHGAHARPGVAAAAAPPLAVLGAPPRKGSPARPSPAEIGRHDERMGQAVERARRVMRSGIPLLIQGESGTGKEWLARSLHEHGPRAAAAFVAVNCAAIPDALIEAELFGYEEGAFTGARRRGSPGRIREADGGTLFLDEIGDMPVNLQARLLRVLQDRAVTPLGSGRSYPVNINVVCATHRRLRDLVAAGTFREDLYYRLNGFTVGLPALRERNDLEPLVQTLLAEEGCDSVGARVSAEAMALFLRHPWPGNIRQLRNVLRTGIALMDEGRVLDMHCLADDFIEEAQAAVKAGLDRSSAADSTARAAVAPAGESSGRRLQEMEWQTIQEALKRLDGNVSAAARQLGISRNRLYRKLREFS